MVIKTDRGSKGCKVRVQPGGGASQSHTTSHIGRDSPELGEAPPPPNSRPVKNDTY